MKFNKKKVVNDKKPTRKQLRKEKRIQKKIKKNDYFSKKVYKNVSEELTPNPKIKPEHDKKQNNNKSKEPTTVSRNSNDDRISIEKHRNKEKKEQNKLQKEMMNQRTKQLSLANEVEDRNIKKLEKHLRLNKRKSKGIPKSFVDDGLNYLLEVCDPDEVKKAVAAEQQFLNFDKDFEEDLALMSNKNSKSTKKDEEDFSDFELDEEYDDINEEFLTDDEMDQCSNEELDGISNDEMDEVDDEETDEFSDEEMKEVDEEEMSEEDVLSELSSSKRNIKNADIIKSNQKLEESKNLLNPKKNKSEQEKGVSNKNVNKKKKLDIKDLSSKNKYTSDDSEISNDESSISDDDTESECHIKGASKINSDGTWEDIYGRLRAKDGTLISKPTLDSAQKYIPPAVRAKIALEGSEDKKAQEKLNRLKKQLKGLINRLAETNMHNIANQIEDLYMNNSRNDINETLTNLILESLVSNVLTPERLLMEHILLIAVLHANVGTEVGAHFLQRVSTEFEKNLSNTSIDDKILDNIVTVLAQLYNFKIFDSKLMYQILNKLSENFIEKNVDCILKILRNVGFNLRKDDPLALRDLILELQKKAATIAENAVSGSRVKFLLDILLAIKNNNMMKIPNYDNTYSEHLKKIMKGFIRKGNYVTQLNISLDDLLRVEEKGKWWVVGSAWTGKDSEISEQTKKVEHTFSQKLLKAARKQRMNTDTRKNIFCIIMSAEDYLDAFEKLLHLGLTNNQDREIIHVILHCCLQEKSYNPYYAYLAQKFCDYDRKYQLTIKYSIWDKLKAIEEQSTGQLSNLAKLLTHLFIENGLSISTLKIVQFKDLDNISLRFIRQIILGILLHENVETCTQVFLKVAQSNKLKMFRESLRLFIEHFLLRNINNESIDDKQKTLLQTRGKMISKLLVMREKLSY